MVHVYICNIVIVRIINKYSNIENIIMNDPLSLHFFRLTLALL